VDQVRLPDFVLPTYSYSIQPDDQGGAPWIGERIRITKDRLSQWGQSSEPMLPNFDPEAVALVLNFEETGQTAYQETIKSLEYDKVPQPQGEDWKKSIEPGSTRGTGTNSPYAREIELWEVHARFATMGGESQDDVVAWYHEPTRTVLRAVYAEAIGAARPYEKITFFPTEGFYGIGYAEQMELFQMLESDLTNQMLNNVVLANSRGIAAKAGSNIAAGEPIYPGKIWITDGDPRQEFMPFAMADIYQSLPQMIGMIQSRGERRGGLGDLQLGQIDQLPSRTPATTTVSLMQEGARRPDLTLKDMRYEGLSVIGLRILQQLQNQTANPDNPEGAQWLEWALDTLGSPEGQEVVKKLKTPVAAVESGVGVAVTATSAGANKELERQKYDALLMQAGSISQQLVQLATVATQAMMQPGGEALAQTAIACGKGISALFRRRLEQDDIRNVEEIAPSASQEVPISAPPVPAGVVPGSDPGAQGSPNGAPMGGLPGGAGNGLPPGV
jgi:hypothetical protein